MEDPIRPTQPAQPTQEPIQAPAEPVAPITEPVQSPEQLTQPVATPAEQPVVTDQPATEESFLRKNKKLIIGGIVGLIVITVVVGILLSLKNTEKLEGLIKLRDQTTQQEQPVKIPRTAN